MTRAFILLMDSFGVGAAHDAPASEKSANTFANIAKAYLEKHGHPLALPNLTRLGLGQLALEAAQKSALPGVTIAPPTAIYGYAEEQSYGKDTPSGHWEIAGVPVLFEWGYFDHFPEKLINDFIQKTGIPGILGNCHASGTTIIQDLGDEHVKTGRPIIYTSADSVFQIAAHEEVIPLGRLYELCEIARTLVDPYNIGRVIARPFIGSSGQYRRTSHRKDYAVPPPAPTLLDAVIKKGGRVLALGKVADIFAHCGISEEIKGENNLDLFDHLLTTTTRAKDGDLVFVNFVDFDSAYGHRRDVEGYAQALMDFDRRLPEFEALLVPGDLAIITADHGCDPTMPGSDHTREMIPILGFGPKIQMKKIGLRKSFADIGQTIANHLHLSPLEHGEKF